MRQAGVPPSSPLEGVGETQRAPSTAQGLVEGGTGGGAERLREMNHLLKASHPDNVAVTFDLDENIPLGSLR